VISDQFEDIKIGIFMLAVSAEDVVVGDHPFTELRDDVVLRTMVLDF